MADVKEQATSTPELQEASATFGDTVNTGYAVFQNGKLDKDDFGVLLNYVINNISGYDGIGKAFGSEIAAATVSDLQSAKAAFDVKLKLPTGKQKFCIPEIYSGLICGIALIKEQGIQQGRQAILKELAEGANFDLLYAAEVPA